MHCRFQEKYSVPVSSATFSIFSSADVIQVWFLVHCMYKERCRSSDKLG